MGAELLQHPIIQGVLVVFIGVGLSAYGELTLAVREIALNSRVSLPEGTRQLSRYDYGGLVVVGWLAILGGATLVLVGLFVILWGT